MHVPWGWIRQRPHFLAEGLSDKYYVSVVTEKIYRKKPLVHNKTSLKQSEIFRLPIKRYSMFDMINNLLVAWQLKKKCKSEDIDIIWLTDVRLYSYLRGADLKGISIIYDCMDETLEFPYIKNNPKLINQLVKDEQDLVEAAAVVFCSSQTLKDRLVLRTGVAESNVSVVHNALDADASKYQPESLENSDFDAVLSKFKRDGYYVFTYIGTISEWFDIQCIVDSLKTNTHIVYFLVGPLEIVLPDHERLIHIKPVEHNYVDYILGKSDALIMPFKVNALIESVDPVKLYEYIRSGKPVIASSYPELDRFSDFVYLYESSSQYQEFVDVIINGDYVNSVEDIADFVSNNNWLNRVEKIKNKLEFL